MARPVNTSGEGGGERKFWKLKAFYVEQIENFGGLVHPNMCFCPVNQDLMFISRGSGLILVCSCIRVRLSWADKTSVLPLFQ